MIRTKMHRLMILLNSGLKRISADSSRFSLLMKDVDYNDGLDIVLVHTIGSLLTALSCMKAHAINIQFYSGRHTKCVGCIRTPVRKVRKTFFHIILSHLYIKSARSYVIVRQYEVIKSVTGGRRILVLRFFFKSWRSRHRLQLVQACEQSPKELTVGKGVEVQRQLLMFGSRNQLAH